METKKSLTGIQNIKMKFLKMHQEEKADESSREKQRRRLKKRKRRHESFPEIPGLRQLGNVGALVEGLGRQE